MQKEQKQFSSHRKKGIIQMKTTYYGRSYASIQIKFHDFDVGGQDDGI